mmetsp:Transcript_14351/g.18761  ORF Transcript_14351/g.18761 Transcript_14351/m.18761 type:complete len:981 (+) Transcript_14351:59-3001(+)
MGDDDYADTEYSNYVSSTVGAEREMFIFTITYLIVLVVLLGPLVCIGRKWKKHRKLRKARKILKAELASTIATPYVLSQTDSMIDTARKRIEREKGRPETLQKGTTAVVGGDFEPSVVEGEEDTLLETFLDEIFDQEEIDEKPKVMEKISHEDENGTPDGQVVELYEMTAFGAKNAIRKRNFNKVNYQIDDEEEDELPKDAFDQYYVAHEEEDEEEDFIKGNRDGLYSPPSDSLFDDTIRGCQTLRLVVGCNKECRKIFRVALPSTFSSISSACLSAMTSAMVAYNFGSEAYTAYAMVGAFLGISDSFVSGIGAAESTLTAQAIGMGNTFMAGQYAQLTCVLYILLAVPTYAVWIYAAPRLMLFMGLGEDVANIASSYVIYSVVSYLINGVSECLDTLLWSADYGTSMTIIDTIFHCIYVAAIAVAVYYFDTSDLNVIAYIGIVYGIVYGIFIYYFTKSKGWLDPFYKGLFRNFALKNWKLVRGVMKMAIPSFIGSFLSYGEWEIFTFFAAYMGPGEVAAWSILGAIWGVFEYAPAGFETAAEIRVAFHLGNGNPGMAKVAAYKNLLYATIWATLVTIFFYYSADTIITYFTADETLIVMLQELVTLISAGNVLMAVGSVAYSILTAQSRVKLATKITFVCSWCINIPLACYWVFRRNYGLDSIVAALIIGYATSEIALLYVVFSSNWAKISKKVMKSGECFVDDTKEDESSLDVFVDDPIGTYKSPTPMVMKTGKRVEKSAHDMKESEAGLDVFMDEFIGTGKSVKESAVEAELDVSLVVLSEAGLDVFMDELSGTDKSPTPLAMKTSEWVDLVMKTSERVDESAHTVKESTYKSPTPLVMKTGERVEESAHDVKESGAGLDIFMDKAIGTYKSPTPLVTKIGEWVETSGIPLKESELGLDVSLDESIECVQESAHDTKESGAVPDVSVDDSIGTYKSAHATEESGAAPDVSVDDSIGTYKSLTPTPSLVPMSFLSKPP